MRLNVNISENLVLERFFASFSLDSHRAIWLYAPFGPLTYHFQEVSNATSQSKKNIGSRRRSEARRYQGPHQSHEGPHGRSTRGLDPAQHHEPGRTDFN